MLFYVRKDVILPNHLSEQEITDIKKRELKYSQEIQRQGKCRHLWRITGKYANISIFEVQSNEELHNLLQGLPLYPYMKIEVIPLNRHPSSIEEGDL